MFDAGGSFQETSTMGIFKKFQLWRHVTADRAPWHPISNKKARESIECTIPRAKVVKPTYDNEYSPECQVQVVAGGDIAMGRHKRPHIATETLTHLHITSRRIFESTAVSAPHLLLRLALAHQAWAVSVPCCLAASE